MSDAIIAAMACAMAPVFTEEGMPIRTPDEGPLDEVEQARWNCLLYAAHEALKAYHAAMSAVRDPEIG